MSTYDIWVGRVQEMAVIPNPRSNNRALDGIIFVS
jgi:hypothetical protein